VAAALAGLRGVKSQAKVSMRAPLARAEVRGPEPLVAGARLAEQDLRRATTIVGELVFTVDPDATELTVDAELAPQEQQG
jgi:valyl-tRNA synthetase